MIEMFFSFSVGVGCAIMAISCVNNLFSNLRIRLCKKGFTLIFRQTASCFVNFLFSPP